MKKNSAEQPVIDLHCDLLSYLAASRERSAYDRGSNCSIPELLEGAVALQIVAIYSKTGANALAFAHAQMQKFCALESTYKELLRFHSSTRLSATEPGDKVYVMAAIENASGFCDENESLKDGLKRFDDMLKQISPVLYVSLTWNGENRFGGGNDSRAGLKDDGRRLLDVLFEKKIAVDFSHTSDSLAEDILSYVERINAPARLLASHSNFRAVCSHVRNLHNDIALELLRRGGVVGCNSIAEFLGGASIESLVKQLRHAELLGKGEGAALGADFFCLEDLPPEVRAARAASMFSGALKNAAAYQHFFAQLESEGAFSKDQIKRLAFENAYRFITSNHF